VYAYNRLVAYPAWKAPLFKMRFIATDPLKLNIHPKSAIPNMEDTNRRSPLISKYFISGIFSLLQHLLNNGL
jgi:hypothetical protein